MVALVNTNENVRTRTVFLSGRRAFHLLSVRRPDVPCVPRVWCGSRCWPARHIRDRPLWQPAGASLIGCTGEMTGDNTVGVPCRGGRSPRMPGPSADGAELRNGMARQRDPGRPSHSPSQWPSRPAQRRPARRADRRDTARSRPHRVVTVSARRGDFPVPRASSPTAICARPFHSARSGPVEVFQASSKTSWAWNGNPASSRRCASTIVSSGVRRIPSGWRGTSVEP